MQHGLFAWIVIELILSTTPFSAIALDLPINIEAYAESTSVAAGGEITLHARGVKGAGEKNYRVRFFRCPNSPKLSEKSNDKLVIAENSMKVADGNDCADCNYTGCNWPGAVFSIGRQWQSGLYMARIGEDGSNVDVYFVVRRHPDDKRREILVQIPFTTVQAYNNWGGGGFYQNPLPPVGRVSFWRPTPFEQVIDGLHGNLRPFLDWLDRNFKSNIDYISSIDLAQGNYAIKGEGGPLYKLFVSAGHDEYWSDRMVDNLLNYIWIGGNAAFLGGNTCDGRVSFSEKFDTMFYKLPGDRWRNHENKTLLLVGLQTPEHDTTRTIYDRSYSLEPSNHWALENVNRQITFGVLCDGSTVVGYEVDERPSPAPGNFETLGTVSYNSVITTRFGIFSNPSKGSGIVFSTGTIDWSRGLAQSESGKGIDVVTRNVFRKLTSLE